MTGILFLGSTFEATGNWGSMICCAATGLVIRYERGGEWEKWGDGYDEITRLDVDEWRAFYPGEDVSGPHDVLGREEHGDLKKLGPWTGVLIRWGPISQQLLESADD